MKFKNILGFRLAANLTIGAMLFGSIVFTVGFGACLLLARQEVTKEVDAKVQSQINYLESYVDGQLQRIEDAGYSLGGSMFGKAIRSENTDGYIELDELFYVRDTPEECYLILEQFMEANPVVCGIAMEFDPNVYSDVESTYGFTPYVTRVTGHLDFCNGGHNAPIILRKHPDGSSEIKYAKMLTNLVVGVMPDFPYRKEEKVLNPGDMLFTYTDGLTEAENSDKTLFGDDATLSALENAINNDIDSVKAYVESMYEAVLHHTAGAEQNDDITMMAIEYKGPSADIRK